MNQSDDSNTSRRRFLHSSTAAAVGGTLASQVGFPAATSGAGNSETLRIGLIGCGGRGTGAAVQALRADKNVELVAMGDVFEDQLQKSLALYGQVVQMRFLLKNWTASLTPPLPGSLW